MAFSKDIEEVPTQKAVLQTGSEEPARGISNFLADNSQELPWKGVFLILSQQASEFPRTSHWVCPVPPVQNGTDGVIHIWLVSIHSVAQNIMYSPQYKCMEIYWPKCI